jgi:hypothetical protein
MAPLAVNKTPQPNVYSTTVARQIADNRRLPYPDISAEDVAAADSGSADIQVIRARRSSRPIELYGYIAQGLAY